jgi:hypothetical protein
MSSGREKVGRGPYSTLDASPLRQQQSANRRNGPDVALTGRRAGMTGKVLGSGHRLASFSSQSA